VAVEVEDRPGGLNNILQILFGNGINVEYMYAFIQQSGQNAVLIFRFDDIDNAVDVLMQNGVTVIGGEKLYAM
jgi:hypothetical protein